MPNDAPTIAHRLFANVADRQRRALADPVCHLGQSTEAHRAAMPITLDDGMPAALVSILTIDHFPSGVPDGTYWHASVSIVREQGILHPASRPETERALDTLTRYACALLRQVGHPKGPIARSLSAGGVVHLLVPVSDAERLLVERAIKARPDRFADA